MTAQPKRTKTTPMQFFKTTIHELPDKKFRIGRRSIDATKHEFGNKIYAATNISYNHLNASPYYGPRFHKIRQYFACNYVKFCVFATMPGNTNEVTFRFVTHHASAFDCHKNFPKSQIPLLFTKCYPKSIKKRIINIAADFDCVGITHATKLRRNY